MTKSLEIFLNGESKDLNLPNNFIFVYCAFPDNFPQPASPSFNIFWFWLKMVSNILPWAVSGSGSVFLGLSCIYAPKYIYY